MPEIEGYNFPDDLLYHKEHMWVKVEDGKARVGVTDFTQKLAGEFSYVEFPEEGDEVEKDQVIGSYETGKWLGKIYAPVSGTIVEINEEVDDDPSLVNEDPYGDGWLFVIEMSNPDELNELMKPDSPEFQEWIKAEIEKHAKK
ncbi:MAG: glycine cleavage system protein GcvH [Candidatus Hydrothermota bacterium]|nr:MAG: glycine cleavage system protein GcvH [Candidatus Hydrothermae bacterium]